MPYQHVFFRIMFAWYSNSNSNSERHSLWRRHLGTATARVHPVHLMNVAPAPGGRRPLDQAVYLSRRSAYTGSYSDYTHHGRPFISTQPESWYSFYHPMEGRRLSWPRVAGFVPRWFTCLLRRRKLPFCTPVSWSWETAEAAWVNNLPKVATQWNSGATRESNPGPRARIPSALTTEALNHTTEGWCLWVVSSWRCDRNSAGLCQWELHPLTAPQSRIRRSVAVKLPASLQAPPRRRQLLTRVSLRPTGLQRNSLAEVGCSSTVIVHRQTWTTSWLPPPTARLCDTR